MQQPNPCIVHPPHLWPQPQTDAYALLAAFFDYISIHEYHFVTNSFIHAACTRQFIPPNPGALLVWYEKTQVLFYAAHILHLTSRGEDLDIGVNVAALPWDQQPHHLAAHEVKDPYIAIEEVFEFQSHKQWLITLHAWMHAALCEDSILEEEGSHHETIMLLHKLADALWLLWLERKASSFNIEH